MTPEELLVVRFFQVPSRVGLEWGAEYKLIPWTDSGLKQSTVNFGIRAIGMLALNENHRAIAVWQNTLPLNVWLEKSDRSGRPVYVHHLSRVL